MPAEVSHIPTAKAYPGMTTLHYEGRTYKAMGIWTAEQMIAAIMEGKNV